MNYDFNFFQVKMNLMTLEKMIMKIKGLMSFDFHEICIILEFKSKYPSICLVHMCIQITEYTDV